MEILTDPYELDSGIHSSIWAPDGSCLFARRPPGYVGQRKRIAVIIESIILAIQENTYHELHTDYALGQMGKKEVTVEPLQMEYAKRALDLVANKKISDSFREDPCPEKCLSTEANASIQVDSIPIQEQVVREEFSQTDIKIEEDDSEISVVFVGKSNYFKATDKDGVIKPTSRKLKNVSSILATPRKPCTDSKVRKNFSCAEVLKTILPGTSTQSVLLNTHVTTPIDKSAVSNEINKSSSETLKSNSLAFKNPYVLLERLPIDNLPVKFSKAVNPSLPKNLPSISPMNIHIENKSKKCIAASVASCNPEDKFVSPLVAPKLICVDPADSGPSSSIVNSKIEIKHHSTSSPKPMSNNCCLESTVTATENKNTNDKKSSRETGIKHNNITLPMPVVMLKRLPAHITCRKSVQSEFTDPSPGAPPRNHSNTTGLADKGGSVLKEIVSVEFSEWNKSSRQHSVSKLPKPIATEPNSRSKSAVSTGGRHYKYKHFEDDKKCKKQLVNHADRSGSDLAASVESRVTRQTTYLRQFLSNEGSPYPSALSTSLSKYVSPKEKKKGTSVKNHLNASERKTNSEASNSKNSFWMGTKKIQKLSWTVKVDDRLSQTMAGPSSVPFSTCHPKESRKRKFDSSTSVESGTHKLDKTIVNNFKTIRSNTTVSPPVFNVNKKVKHDKISPINEASISTNSKLSMWQGGKKSKIQWVI